MLKIVHKSRANIGSEMLIHRNNSTIFAFEVLLKCRYLAYNLKSLNLMLILRCNFLLFMLLNLAASSAFAGNGIEFTENKGQWTEQVIYKADIPAGSLFLEKHAFTYNFYDGLAVAGSHGADGKHEPFPKLLDCHAFKVHFRGSSSKAVVQGSGDMQGVKNYFIGSDQSKWAGGVKSYQTVAYTDIYPATDLKLYASAGALKYDFILHPGASPSAIRLEYEGVDELYLDRGNLYIKTSVNTLVEHAPYAFQVVDGSKVEVKCNFVLRENMVLFEFPNGFHKDIELVIDPKIVFASYSGSTNDNWGATATYDEDGNLYGGGIVFGTGYPTTTGAYQIGFAGGEPVNQGGVSHPGFDIAVSKFNSTGTSLLYSTYLGGNSNEFAHSLVVDNNNALVIFGTTGSANFPVTSNAYQKSFKGGAAIGDYLPFPNGSDMFVSKLSPDGSILQASTFMGGTENDGFNISQFLDYNYGDMFRGDVTIDDNNNVYVASTTLSHDFPVSFGAFQGVHAGMLDACIFKLNIDFSALLLSTFVGGTADDAAYSIELDAARNIYVCGGTTSFNFPATPNALHSTSRGGADGFIVRLSTLGTTIIAGTYLGTTSYDQAYILDLDQAGNVYVFGQCDGNYPVTPNTYANPNSSQFLHKLNSTLQTTLMSTVIGSGRGTIDISPTALLVSDCDHIYISGWGGRVNVDNSQASHSSTKGLPITSDAFQSTTDDSGSDFYFGVFSRDATALTYGTFFGGRNSQEHVDGGTSRFDKNGNIYQAVCAGCQGRDDLPTTADAWSQINGSTNCNLGVVKFNLAELTADISVPVDHICFPEPAVFKNLSNGGTSFLWDFGDGTTSTEFEPTKTYADTGTYIVSLTIYDSLTCKKFDADVKVVSVGLPPKIVIEAAESICFGDQIQLVAPEGYVDYLWTITETGNTVEWPAGVLGSDTLNDAIITNNGMTGASITVQPTETTSYTVVAVDQYGCKSETNGVQVVTVNPLPTLDGGEDVLISWLNGETQLFGDVGKNAFYWAYDSTLSCTDCPNPFARPTTTTDYYLTVINSNGCKNTDTVRVFVDGSFYVPNCFTPNADGRNDAFLVYGKELETVQMWIYDRWGNEIYYTTDRGAGWNGKNQHTGRPVQVDTYVWKVLAIEYSGLEHAATGIVTLVK